MNGSVSGTCHKPTTGLLTNSAACEQIAPMPLVIEPHETEVSTRPLEHSGRESLK